MDISRGDLDEQVFEEEFSPVRRRSRRVADMAKMFIPPEPVLSNIKYVLSIHDDIRFVTS